jgi:hypothetical protein
MQIWHGKPKQPIGSAGVPWRTFIRVMSGVRANDGQHETSILQYEYEHHSCSSYHRSQRRTSERHDGSNMAASEGQNYAYNGNNSDAAFCSFEHRAE